MNELKNKEIKHVMEVVIESIVSTDKGLSFEDSEELFTYLKNFINSNVKPVICNQCYARVIEDDE